jgi:hypothetical protein
MTSNVNPYESPHPIEDEPVAPRNLARWVSIASIPSGCTLASIYVGLVELPSKDPNAWPVIIGALLYSMLIAYITKNALLSALCCWLPIAVSSAFVCWDRGWSFAQIPQTAAIAASMSLPPWLLARFRARTRKP